jgi:hypothetical protein
MLSLVQVCSEFIMIVTRLQLFLWWKGGVGRSGTPLAHIPEPTSTILTLLLVEERFSFC